MAVAHAEFLHRRFHFYVLRSSETLRPRVAGRIHLSLPMEDYTSRRLRFSCSSFRMRSGRVSRTLLVTCSSLENSSEHRQSSNTWGTPKIKEDFPFMKMLKGAGSFLPVAVIASAVLAIIYPPSFTWFTSRYYAPALGFLMFAVGLNSTEKDFIEAFNRPSAVVAGYTGQFLVKPLLGYLFGSISMAIFGLPASLAAGIMLTSCVSGAQLSNYATFLTDPQMAPLSIVMTSLSTATAVFVTPSLSLLLIGKKLPVDVKGMVANILQIVVTPIATGLLLNRFFPKISDVIRPFLPSLSVFVTSLCVGAPLAINVKLISTPSGISVLLLVIAFHISAFVAGYGLTGIFFRKSSDVKALQRTLSYETGMQSSLLALALANKFFPDPLVSIPPAISTVIMALMGFSLVLVWSQKKESLP